GGFGNSTPLILLNGTSAGSASNGVLLQGSSDAVSGLIIEHFNNGITVTGANNTVGGPAINVALKGNVSVSPGNGNVISGNRNDGVLSASGVSGVQVQGNFIGTNTAGNAALANKVGIEVAGSTTAIGGTTSGARNIISGNTTNGVLIDSTASA